MPAFYLIAGLAILTGTAHLQRRRNRAFSQRIREAAVAQDHEAFEDAVDLNRRVAFLIMLGCITGGALLGSGLGALIWP